MEEEVAKYLGENRFILEPAFNHFSEESININQLPSNDFDNIINTEPIKSVINECEPKFRPIKTNYIEREQNNRLLGEQGEQLVINYERWRLIKAGKEDLVDKIEWISKNLGDGTGYDILSKNINGSDRYIEVKTTKLSKETPFYLTKTELSFASLKRNNFYLYRVFNFDSKPQFFIRQGEYGGFCNLEPVTFRAYC